MATINGNNGNKIYTTKGQPQMATMATQWTLQNDKIATMATE
jgi:hypothetical protein